MSKVFLYAISVIHGLTEVNLPRSSVIPRLTAVRFDGNRIILAGVEVSLTMKEIIFSRAAVIPRMIQGSLVVSLSACTAFQAAPSERASGTACWSREPAKEKRSAAITAAIQVRRTAP